jgi:hypothetical protein
LGGVAGGEDGAVELLVGELKPGGALVVEVGEGAFFEAGVVRGGGYALDLIDSCSNP